MEDRTCPVCDKTFTPRTRNQKYCGPTKSRCYRRATNAAYRELKVEAKCKHCGATFLRNRTQEWSARNGHHTKSYCSLECQYAERAEEYAKRGIHPPQVSAEVVEARQQARRTEQVLAGVTTEPGPYGMTRYRKDLRRDPCAYCGGEAEALDHIIPKAEGGGDGWENRTATCHQCNSLKGQASVLEALLFIPPAKRYHELRRVLFA